MNPYLKPKASSSLKMGRTFKAILLGSLCFLSACATTQTPYDRNNSAAAMQDITSAPALPEGFGTQPLTLEDVRILAVTRNAQYQQKTLRMLQNVQKRGGNAKEVLPKIYLNSFGRWRNNTDASIGMRVDDPSANMPVDFFTAQDRSFANSDMTLSWNLLDLGLAGYRNQISDIENLDNAETLRLGCHQLTVDVERAYWRMAAFQKAAKKSDWLKARIDYALEQSDGYIGSHPEAHLTELMYQRELIDIKRWYESLFRALSAAKSDMTKLMNMAPGTRFDVSIESKPIETSTDTNLDITALIQQAFENRPEVRRALYTIDKSKLQNKQDILRQLPALGLFLSGNNDTNSFKLNQDFLSAGLNLSWNILGLLDVDNKKKSGQMETDLKVNEAQVLASAILAQILLSLQEVENLEHEIDLAWKAKDVQREITEKLEQDYKSGAGRETHLIKEELMRELSVLREDLSRAELFAAQARYNQSLGAVKFCEAPLGE